MQQKQTPNEILLNYPKLKGGKGIYKRPVIPPREKTPSFGGRYGGHSETLDLNFERRMNAWIGRKSEGSESTEEEKEKRMRRDSFDDVLRYRPTFVARMSGLTYVRSPSARCPRRKVNSATSRITRARQPSSASIQRPTTATSVTSMGTTVPLKWEERSMSTGGNNSYRWQAMSEVYSLRDTERSALSPQVLVDNLKMESRQRRLARMTHEEFNQFKRSRNQLQNLTQFFNLRMAFRVIKWKNKALATLAANRANSEKIAQRKAYIKRLFKTRAKAIMLIYRWYKTLMTNSIEKTEKSAMELHWEENYLNENRRKKFEFDTAAFEQQKKQAKMPKWVKLILQKPPSGRSKVEVKQLHDLFKGLSHLEKFSQKVQFELCRAFTLLEVDPMRVILRQGHKGQAFYFIYTGSVFVNTTESMNDRRRKTQYQKTRAILTRGEAFGEVALLRDTERMATVIAREPCELLCVDRDTFSNMCPQLFDHELKYRVAYMQTHDLFVEGWDALALYNMAMSSTVAEFPINQVISKNIFEDQFVYFVMEGFCNVIKCLNIDTPASKSVLQPHHTTLLANESSQSQIEDAKNEDFVNLLNDRAKVRTQSRSGDELRKLSDNQLINKGSLFEAMDMTYGKDLGPKVTFDLAEKEDKHGLGKIFQEHKELDYSTKVRLQREKDLQAMKDSTRSFTVYMSLAEKAARMQNKNAVFMQLRRLKTGDVFNIRDTFRANEAEKDLLLVSENCKLLKVKIFDLLQSLRQQDVQIFLANKVRSLMFKYPEESDMVKLFRKNCNWEAYRQSLVNSASKSRKSAKGKKGEEQTQGSKLMEKLGKPWRADPERWLSVVNETNRQTQIKLNEPLKPPIY